MGSEPLAIISKQQGEPYNNGADKLLFYHLSIILVSVAANLATRLSPFIYLF